MAPQHTGDDAAPHPEQPAYCQHRQRLQRQRACGSIHAARTESGLSLLPMARGSCDTARNEVRLLTCCHLAEADQGVQASAKDLCR